MCAAVGSGIVLVSGMAACVWEYACTKSSFQQQQQGILQYGCCCAALLVTS
jgi:hypothetical protein